MNGKEILDYLNTPLWICDEDHITHKFIDALEVEDFIEREIEILRGVLITIEDRAEAEDISATISGLNNALFWVSVLQNDKNCAEGIFNKIYRKQN